jgi:hypothetical protein
MTLRDLILFGKSQEEMNEQALPLAESAGGYDKALHQLASALLTERFGPTVAAALGLGKEVYTGGLEWVEGRPFISETGFDPADIRANVQGIRNSANLAALMGR